jgi:hypothetical protein
MRRIKDVEHASVSTETDRALAGLNLEHLVVGIIRVPAVLPFLILIATNLAVFG